MRKRCICLTVLVLLCLSGCTAAQNNSVTVTPVSWAEGKDVWMQAHLGAAYRCYDVQADHLPEDQGMAVAVERWEQGVLAEELGGLAQPIAGTELRRGKISVSLHWQGTTDSPQRDMRVILAMSSADTGGKTATGHVSRAVDAVGLPVAEGAGYYWLDAPTVSEDDINTQYIGGYFCGTKGYSDWERAVNDHDWALLFRIQPQ